MNARSRFIALAASGLLTATAVSLPSVAPAEHGIVYHVTATTK